MKISRSELEKGGQTIRLNSKTKCKSTINQGETKISRTNFKDSGWPTVTQNEQLHQGVRRVSAHLVY